VSRGVRLPFSFGQRVDHSSFTFPFIVVAQECNNLNDWTISVTDEKGGGWWRFPAGELTFSNIEDEQKAMAQWMGCTVERMNRFHDRIHQWLAERVGQPSHSLRISHGEILNPDEHAIAAAEEDAVLAVQKYLVTVERHALRIGTDVPV